MPKGSGLDDSFFREVAVATTEGIISVDEEGQIVFANPAVERILGHDPSALLDRQIDAVFPNSCNEPLSVVRAQAGREDQRSVELVSSLVHSGGYEVPISSSVRSTDQNDTRVFTLAFRDRSTLKDEELHRKVFQHSNDAILVIDPEGDEITACNPRACKLFGYSREELVSLGPRDLHPHDMTAYREFVSEVLKAGAGRTDKLGCRTKDGLTLPAEVSASAIELEGRHRIIAIVRDLSERRERARELLRYETMVETVGEGVYTLDKNLRFTAVNEGMVGLTGYSKEELVGMPISELFVGEADDISPGDYEDLLSPDMTAVVDVETAQAARKQLLGADREVMKVECPIRTKDGELVPCEVRFSALKTASEFRRTAGVFMDITDRIDRERQLESLNEVARTLMAAESVDEIASVGTDAIPRILGFDVACVRLFDDDTGELDRAALTDAARELLESRTAYDLEATLAGRSLRRNETLVDDRPDQPSDVPGSVASPSLHTPIGNHGVLSVIGKERGFERRDVHLAEMIGVTIRNAITQAERSQLLKRHEEELRQQRDQLNTLNRINELVQEIGKRLSESMARDDLEDMVCERLAASDLYESAWIGGGAVTGDRVVAHTGANVEDDYLEAIETMPLSRIEHGTVKRAIETGEIQVDRRYHVRDEESETNHPGANGFEAVAAVPLTYGDRVQGVLVLRGGRDVIFGENALGGFESLGKMVGLAINASRNRELLLSDEVVELEFEIGHEASFYTRITHELDCRCRFERAVPTEEGRSINYHRIEGADPGEILDFVDKTDRIEEARIVSEGENEVLLQTVTDRSSVQVVLETGGTIRSAIADDGQAIVTIEAPQNANIREIADAFRSTYPDGTLVAKREAHRPVRTVEDLRETLDDILTEKQRGALEAAYFAGYFKWPREITAEELAESLGVSSPTLHQHLRRGEERILSAFLDDSDG